MTPNAPPDDALVPVFGPDGTVKVVGLGGVGGIVARYVSIFLASLDRPIRLVCIDGDEFEPANASRMLFSHHGNKAAVTVDDLIEQTGDSHLSLLAVAEYVTAENIARLLRSGDHVLLAVDNHATRRLVSDHCAGLRDIVLISGGNDGIETSAAGRQLRGTYGNCQIHIRRAGEDLSPSLTRYHREIREPRDRLPTDKSCTELIASVPQILFANLAVASAMLNAFWLYLCGALHYSEVAFDIFEGRMQPVPLPAPRLPRAPAPVA